MTLAVALISTSIWLLDRPQLTTNQQPRQRIFNSPEQDTEMANAKAEELRRRVQSLPADLFNLVLEFVFTPSGTAVISCDYKQSSSLRVSRAIRQPLILDYYSKTTLTLRKGDYYLFASRSVRLPYAFRLAETCGATLTVI